MKFKTTIPEQEPSKPGNSGARAIPGKTNECDSVMTDAKVLDAKPEAVRDAEEIPGKALECIEQQVGNDANPKKRDASVAGTGHAAAENKKALSK